MGSYSYKLYKRNGTNEEKEKEVKYDKEELKLMTTYQLREICKSEKLVKSIMNPMDREELIHIIMRFRGESHKKFIQKKHEGGFGELQDFMRSVEIIEEPQDTSINNPAQLTIYSGIEMNQFDGVYVGSEDAIPEGNVLLVSGVGEISCIFNVMKDNRGGLFLYKGGDVEAVESFNKNYSLLYFPKEDSDILHDIYTGRRKIFPKYIKLKRYPIMDFQIKEVEESSIPLAVDFGSSNTTAGTFKRDSGRDEKLHLVEVIDISTKRYERTPLIPTVVAVSGITEKEVSYTFGYQAERMSKISFIDEGFCVFYDIKRWMSDIDRMEEVTDIEGNRAFVKRRDIIREYLLYVVGESQQRFKCTFKRLHISCPVKQKSRFAKIIRELLPEYEIETDNMLDEGAAVLYNTISELIEKDRYQDNEIYKALIIDCGGGTTDLTSCDFSVCNRRVSYEIKIETSYENGDTDFGGNNLTFRLMQFLKVMMVQKLTKDDRFSVRRIMEGFDIDIFRFVDSHDREELYKELDTQYELAESVIPTKFKEYQGSRKDEYFKVKNNFYGLFELAERVKKSFFSKEGTLQKKIVSEMRKGSSGDFIMVDKWTIATCSSGKLSLLKNIPNMDINVHQLQCLMKGDIYWILKKFLDKLYKEDKLYEFSIIKLTGQSCKVEIFKEALKEFIPGKVIQFKKNKPGERHDLKLACLKGSLKYLKAKKFGYAKVILDTRVESLPYDITAFTHTGEEKVLIENSSQQYKRGGCISRNMENLILKLHLKDSEGVKRHEYSYEVSPEDFGPALVEDIISRFGDKINQHETDNILNDEVKFFVWAEEEQWGFKVVPVLREDESLFVGKEEFFSFENDEWEINFFDGMK